MLSKAAAELLRTFGVVFAYLVLLAVTWAAALGAARLVASSRPDETRRTGAFLGSSPGRCLLSGIAHLIVAVVLVRILGAVNGLLGVLFGLWCLRNVLRGAVAWWIRRGGEVHGWRHGTAGAEAENLDEGLRAFVMAAAFPVFGWFFALFVLLQGLGAETLTMMGRRPEAVVDAGDPPVTDDALDEDADLEDEAADHDVDEEEARG